MALMFAFSGQGLQNSKMFDKLKNCDTGNEYLSKASKLIGIDLGNENEVAKHLFEQKMAQLFITIMSKGVYELISDKIVGDFCGYSLGEAIAFLCSANISLEKSLEFIEKRAFFMLEAISNNENEYVMLSIKDGIDLAQIDVIALANCCAMAIKISQTQAIIAGKQADIQNCAKAAKLAGARFVSQVNVNIPSHTQFLKTATPKFREYLRQYEVLKLTRPILDALTISKNFISKNELDVLANELSTTLRFDLLLNGAIEYGYDLILEIGSGFALKSMFSATKRYTSVFSINDFETIDGINKFFENMQQKIV